VVTYAYGMPAPELARNGFDVPPTMAVAKIPVMEVSAKKDANVPVLLSVPPTVVPPAIKLSDPLCGSIRYTHAPPDAHCTGRFAFAEQCTVTIRTARGAS